MIKLFFLFLMMVGFYVKLMPVYAKTQAQEFLLEVKNIKWLKQEPKLICNDLIKAPRFKIIEQESKKNISFTFQKVDYSVPEISNEKNNLTFQYAADLDGGSESTSIMIKGKLIEREFSGVSNIEVKKDVSLLKPGQSTQRDKHQYHCNVSYTFQGRLHSAQ